MPPKLRMIIPPQIRAAINPYSGYISPNSNFGKMGLKALFLCPENRQYLAQEIYLMLCNEDFVGETMGGGLIRAAITGFKRSAPQIRELVENYIFIHKLPYPEDLQIKNPVQQLHKVNMEFIVGMARNIIFSPDGIIALNEINPDTGANEDNLYYQYSAASYSDGTWHPEHLFTRSYRNKHAGYWKPHTVDISSDPMATGLGHKYNNYIYHGGDTDLAARPINRKHNKPYNGPETNGRRGGCAPWGQFPQWQYSMNRRNYDRDNSESLREGGESDRRVQSARGYNMADLIQKSTY